jgi:trans-2,3-dihydro-3-hydroxyanthranilate isomerase
VNIRYHILDVFTDQPLGGNPLAVIPEADGIPEPLLPRIAREFNLSETVFVLRPRKEGALRRLRIFTPEVEHPFAGHPTVGTAILLAERGLVTFAGEYARFSLEEEVGLIRIRVRRRIGTPTFAELTAAMLPEAGPPAPAREDLARLLGIPVQGLAGRPDEPQAWSCGVPFLFIAVRDRATLGRIRLDPTEWRRCLAGYWAPHVFVFCRDPERQGSDLRARMFAPAMGIPEDPATGGAAAALAGYLAARSESPSGTLRWTLEQGFELGRPSLLQLECDLEAGRVRSVRVGGTAVPLMEGVLHLP